MQLLLHNTHSPNSTLQLLFIVLYSMLLSAPVIAQPDSNAAAALQAGEQAYRQADFAEAIGHFYSVQNIQEIAKKAQLTAALGLGNSYLQLANYDSANKWTTIAWEIGEPEKNNFPALWGKVLELKGNYYRASENWDDASIYLEEALNWRKSFDTPTLLDSYIALGNNYLKQGMLRKAREQFEAGEKLVGAQLDSLSYARNLILGGYIDLYWGDFRESVDYLLQAERVFKKLGLNSHTELAFAYTLLGYNYGSTEELKKSLEYCQKAREIQIEKLDAEHPILAVTYYYTGNTLARMRDHAQALEFYKQALRIWTTQYGENHQRVGTLYSTIGLAYRGLQQYEEGLVVMEKAINILSNLPREYPFLHQVYMSKAYLEMESNRLEDALISLKKALALGEKNLSPNSPYMISIHRAFGDCYKMMKQYPEAIKHCEISIAKAGNESSQYVDKARNYFLLSNIYLETNQPDIGLEKVQQALHILDANYPEDWRKSDPGPNLYSNPGLMLEVFIEKGRLLQAKSFQAEDPQYLQLGLKTLLNGADLVDSMRIRMLSETGQLRWAVTAKGLYELAIAQCWELYQLTNNENYLDQAFQLSEKSKSLLLLMQMRELLAKESVGIPPELLAYEQKINDQLVDAQTRIFRAVNQEAETDSTNMLQWESEVFALKQSRDSLRKLFEKDFPAYYSIKYKQESLIVSEAQQMLDDSTVLIEYFIGDNSGYVFWISKNGAGASQLWHGTNLTKSLEQFRTWVTGPPDGYDKEEYTREFAQLAFHLYEELLEPIAEEVNTFPNWVIVPDGPLGYINLGTLISDMPKELGNYHSYDFVLWDHTIANEYSVGLMRHLKNLPKEDQIIGKVLAFAPEFKGDYPLAQEQAVRGGYNPLPYARQELEGISKWFATNKFMGTDASEINFIQHATNYQIIHLSSHAKAGDENPMAAHIAFAERGGREGDNTLMLAEIYNYRLHADMVVLSACETGIGKLFKGEGVMSLARGFTFAGAKSMIMSLWQVNDASTAEIMTRFYENLSKGYNKDLALQQAQRDYLLSNDQIHSHPFYWAGFVATGNMAPLSINSDNSLVWIMMFSVLALLIGLLALRPVKKLLR